MIYTIFQKVWEINNFYRLISYFLLAVFSLVNITGVSAQT